MKINNIKTKLALVFSVLLLIGCTSKDELDVSFPEDGFEMVTPTISNINLNFSLPENPAFTIVWVDGVTGTTNYDIQMSSTSDFASSVMLGTSTEKTFTMTVEDFNEALLTIGVNAYESTTVYIRVLAGSTATNAVNFSVTAYPDAPPIIDSPDNTFSIILSDVDPDATAFTVSYSDPDFNSDLMNTEVTILYELEVAKTGTDFASPVTLATGTNVFEVVVTHGDLNQAALNMGLDPEVASSMDIRIKASIEADGGDFIRFSDGVTITVTPYSTALPPVLWVVGGGVEGTGWGWSNPVSFPLSGVVYSANINLTTNENGAFRFFLQQDWGPDSYNYPYFEARGYTIDPNLINANDGDSNFKFIGTAGLYNLRIDTANKTITLGDPVYGPAISDWGVVGSGYNNWGAFADGAFYGTDDPNVIVSYVTLVAGEIKFRQNNSWDAPNINYGDDGADGTLDQNGANIAVTAGTYKITLNINALTYTLEPYSWGIVGSGYNNWAQPMDHDNNPATPDITLPDAKFYYDPTSDTWKAGVKLVDGEIKVRLNNDWGTNYGASGSSLVQDGPNIPVTAGHYLMTIDLNNNTYSLQSANVLGVVGSGYNDWACATCVPDFSLTQINSDTIVGDIVTLIDGEIKFRQNNSWDAPNINYGDNGADGTLDQDGANIVVTAGQYRVVIDLVSNTYKLNKVQ